MRHVNLMRWGREGGKRDGTDDCTIHPPLPVLYTPSPCHLSFVPRSLNPPLIAVSSSRVDNLGPLSRPCHLHGPGCPVGLAHPLLVSLPCNLATCCHLAGAACQSCQREPEAAPADLRTEAGVFQGLACPSWRCQQEHRLA